MYSCTNVAKVNIMHIAINVSLSIYVILCSENVLVKCKNYFTTQCGYQKKIFFQRHWSPIFELMN